jgi:tetratricopeptide (TPR) repeat protein
MNDILVHPTAASPRRLQIPALMTLIALLALLALAAPRAWAQKPPNISPGEIALLPEYCGETQTMTEVDPRGSARGAYWSGMLGQGFWGLHHYCWGLIRVNRSTQPGLPSYIRRGMHEAAINDYRYVLANAQPGFLLAPEILVRIGESYLFLQNYGMAMEAFARARQLKPGYWPPYVRWAAVLYATGKKREALAHLEEAMRLEPEETALIEPYKRYGGDHAKFLKSLPPRAPEAAASAANAAASASDSSASAPTAPTPPQAASAPEPAASSSP